MSEINVTGLAASDPIPGNYIEINFGAGDASAASNVYSAIIFANKLSTGSASTDTVYGPDTAVPVTNEADVIALFGARSEARRMARRFWAVNKTTPLYFICPPESAGAQATGTITFTTSASSNATARIWCGDEYTDVPINNGDAVATVASAAASAINGMSHWPITATAALGVVTVTAAQKGLRGNSIRISAQIFPTAGMTVSPVAPTALTGGTTADSWTGAIAALEGKKFYYHVLAAEDSTTINAVVAAVNAKAEPITGKRQRVIAGSADTNANSITVATSANAVRAELEWQWESDLTPGELAANNGAIYSLFEAPPRPRCNFNSFGSDAQTAPYWLIKAPRSGKAPTRAQIQAALMNGVTPIAVGERGTAYIVKRITTRSLNGSNPDYRVRDAHKVTVMDRFADEIAARAAASLGGAEIADDPEPGKPPPGSASGAKVVTPRVVKSLVNKLTKDYGDAALLQNTKEIIANTVAFRSEANRGRMGVRVPVQVIDVLDQTVFALDQV